MNVTSALGWILGSQAPSGAIDVVAIRRADGSVSCSPFHVKFPVDKRTATEKLVKLKINGNETKLLMKLGSAGEAFFVERTKRKEFVLKRLRASPPLDISHKGSTTVEGNSMSASLDKLCLSPDETDSNKPVSSLSSRFSTLRRVRSENDLPSSPRSSCATPTVLAVPSHDCVSPTDPNSPQRMNPSHNFSLDMDDVPAGAFEGTCHGTDGDGGDSGGFSRATKRRSYTIAEGVSMESFDSLNHSPITGDSGTAMLDQRSIGAENSTKRESNEENVSAITGDPLTAENLRRLNKVQSKKERSEKSEKPHKQQHHRQEDEKQQESGKVESDKPVGASLKAPPEEWTWTWGDLPIKTTDPSLADLRSLTDMALRQKHQHRQEDASASSRGYVDGMDVNAVEFDSVEAVSDGKYYSPRHHPSDNEKRQSAGSTVGFSRSAGMEYRDYREEGDLSSTNTHNRISSTNGSQDAVGKTGPESNELSKETAYKTHLQPMKSQDTVRETTPSASGIMKCSESEVLGDMPEPKHGSSYKVDTKRDERPSAEDRCVHADYRQHPVSPVVQSHHDRQGSEWSKSGFEDRDEKVGGGLPAQRVLSIRSRASQVAAALGSDRTLSLCAHILCGPDAPCTVEGLRKVLQEHQVTPKEFAATPLEVLNHPSLVVVANDVLIPWRLVHANLMESSQSKLPSQESEPVSVQETSLQQSTHESDGSSAHVPTARAGSSGSMDMGMEYRRLFRWAGLHVNAWEAHMNDTTQGDTKSPMKEGSECNMVTIESADKMAGYSSSEAPHRRGSGVGLDSASEVSGGAGGGMTRARRDSYKSNASNDEQYDFDLMECFSEVSTSTGTGGNDTAVGQSPSYIAGEYRYGSSGDLPGMGMWSKEALDWNSVDDFQRLLNECTRQDSVPDLLKPYVTGTLWGEDDENEDGSGGLDIDLSTSSSNTTGAKVERSAATVGGISTEQEMKALPKLDPSKKKNISKAYVDMSSPVELSRGVSNHSGNSSVGAMAISKSHGTGLDMMGIATSPPLGLSLAEKPSYAAVTAAADGAIVDHGAVTVAVDSEELIEVDVDVDDGMIAAQDTAEDFLSLHDISLDDILPGPARGDVYDGSDTDSFYSLSIDDNEAATSVQQANSVDNVKDNDKERARVLSRKYLYRKTLVPTQEQIQAMELQDGQNEIVFEVEGNVVTANIFVWPEDAKVIVADIEGAIFVSGNSGGGTGALGLMMSLWGSTSARRETHEGLAQLFNNIASNGYRFLYIATKPDASQKDQLLKSKSSSGGDSDQGLPPGPVFLPPDALIQAFGMARSDLFKAAALRGVRSLFPSQHNPYHAAFGAHARDVRAFERCEIPLGRTFLVNEKGEVTTMSTIHMKRTFNEMASLLHQVFPAVADAFVRKQLAFASTLATSETEDSYNDFNFWRTPPPPPPPMP